LNPTATENIVLVDFRAGAPPSVAEAVQQANFSPPGTLLKPTSVRALQRVTAAPFLLAIVLTVLLIAAGAYLLTTSIRAAHRDLAVLRALGTNRRQLRAIVHCHACLVAAFVAIVGVPAGVILGRWVVRLITDALGIVPGAETPPLLMLGLVAAVLVVTNVLALLPARRAAGVRLALLSRDA
jgi:putative ABC transport system permease protein